jgi:hypothetical protein
VATVAAVIGLAVVGLTIGVVGWSVILNPSTAAEVSPAGFHELGPAYAGKLIGVEGDVSFLQTDRTGRVVGFSLVTDVGGGGYVGQVEFSVSGEDWIKTAKRVRAVGTYDRGKLHSCRFVKLK